MNFITSRTSNESEPMTLEQVRVSAPSVFADHPWGGVSTRYSFIPTIDVVNSLLAEGWNITRAKQQRVMLPEKTEFTRHILRLRRSFGPLAVGDVFPEIVLLNSHDRGSAYQMHAGLYRLVCSNGLVVDDSTFARLSILMMCEPEPSRSPTKYRESWEKSIRCEPLSLRRTNEEYLQKLPYLSNLMILYQLNRGSFLCPTDTQIIKQTYGPPSMRYRKT
jgi:hypothetical protein